MEPRDVLDLIFRPGFSTAEQVTTAQAMGDNLLARLQAAGMSFEVVD